MAAGKTTVRIGNAGGYWGDDPQAWERQLRGGPLHYLTADYLAETTMSLLHRARAADPALGYAVDFIRHLAPLVGECLKGGVRVVTNAGGINPTGCAEALLAALPPGGPAPKIAVVSGDDILDRVGLLNAGGVSFAHLDTGEGFAKVVTKLTAANVYFGSAPIVAALAAGADIVITGRVADAALVLGPLIHELGWKTTDWDKLAAGTIAGHLLECGAQVTGGNFTDWRRVHNFHRIGYPVVEVSSDGSFVLTKAPGSGGLVSVETVKEQALYEIGDPRAYVTADVIVDFTAIALATDGPDRVRVSGARGFEPTTQYKVSMAFDDGFRSSGGVLVSGPEAAEKANAYANIFWHRCPPLQETLTELVGWNAFHGAAGSPVPGDEIWLRLSGHDADRKKLQAFGKLLPALILSGPPGITYTGAIPTPQEVVRFWPALVPKRDLSARVSLWEGRWKALPEMDGAPMGIAMGARSSGAAVEVVETTSRPLAEAFSARGTPGAMPLSALAFARSGDKGDTLNLGVLARSPSLYLYLKRVLTAQRVKDWFQERCLGRVTRYEADNLHGFNFVLEAALAGGGTASLRLDALGKGMGQAILRQWLEVPDEVRREAEALQKSQPR